MKKVILIILIFSFLVGCKNKDETEKNSYLTMKSNLLEAKKFTSSDNIPCEITISVNRLSNEVVSYVVTLSNPRENMKNIKALVVHNYYTENVFPSVGLFDKKPSLIINNKKQNKIKLKGKIETTDDIDKLNLKLKVLIEYLNDDNEVKDIYYKTT